jgi:hypothetical protein
MFVPEEEMMDGFAERETDSVRIHTAKSVKPGLPRRGKRCAVLVFLALCVAGFLGRWAILSGCPPIVTADTAAYEQTLKDGTLRNLFYQRRPCGYPLIMKAFAYNRTSVIFFQRVLAGISWLCVAIAFAARLRRPILQWLAGISLFVFGCSPIVICWDIILRPVSVSISVFLLLVTMLLCWNSRQRNLAGLCCLLLIALCFSLLRAENVFILPALFLYLILPELRTLRRDIPPGRGVQARWKNLMRIFLICLVPACFLFLHHENKSARRWKKPLINSLNLRVFVQGIADGKIVLNRDYFRYFVDQHGMPANEALLHIGLKAWDKTGKPTPVYDEWVSEHGYDAYMTFLRSHPRYVLNTYVRSGRLYSIDGWWMIRQFPGWKESFVEARINGAFFTQAIFIYTVGLPLFLTYAFPLMLLTALAMGIWWVCSRLSGKMTAFSGELAGIFSLLFFFSSVIALVALFADADAYWRHSIIGIVSYYLASIMLLWVLLDRLASGYSVRIVRKEP